MSAQKSTSGNSQEKSQASKRQSRVAEINQLSKGPSSFERRRRRSSSSKDAPAHSESNIVNVLANAPDPQSAESPRSTPPGGASRVSSQVSLTSLVRSKALQSVGDYCPIQHDHSIHDPQYQHQQDSPINTRYPPQDMPFPGPNRDGRGEGSPPLSHIPDPSSPPSSRPGATNLQNSSATTDGPHLQRVASSKRLRATTLDVPGLTRSKISPDGRIAKDDVGAKLVVVMVGSPARGKSYITKKLARFLNWQQHDCRIFNVGNTRRKASKNVGPSREPLPGDTESPESTHPEEQAAAASANTATTSQEGDFFSPDNPETVALREKWAEDTSNESLDYILEGEGSVGILDATNTTVGRRKRVMNIIDKRSNGQLKVLFLESICTQRHIIENNVRSKSSGPDYRHMDQQRAINDFLSRLSNYEKAYEPISSEEEADRSFQYVKFINVGQKFECGNIKGFLSGQVVFFSSNFNLRPRQIWITRHGESTDNQLGKIGGDAGLTERGFKYANALSEFMKFKKQEFQARLIKEENEKLQILKNSGSRPPTPENEPADQNFCVWTSMLRRTIETANSFCDNDFDVKEMRMLNELDPGVCGGMTYEEIKQKYPSEYEARMQDKIRYRYPGIGGESYLDVINRLRPVIVEIERMEDNCLVICHRVVARVLLSYFMNLGRDAIGDLEVPSHTSYVLEPKPYGVDWALYKYNERFNWFYEVAPEDAQVQSQSRDKKRRYTVVPTAGMNLGVDSELLERARNQSEADQNAVADTSSEEDEEDDKNTDPEEENDKQKSDQSNRTNTNRATAFSSRRRMVSPGSEPPSSAFSHLTTNS